uniref:Uncharacterized protein n=1 Tax=Hemiselmis andersenii TaxID=464988 RepID=A0A6U4IS68_HEMAN
MPATNWREVTFSRAHLRPNDGLDPEVKKLRTKTKQLAKTGELNNYAQAMSLAANSETRKQKALDQLRTDEVTRQEAEKRNLAEALKMREADTIGLWDHKRKLVMQHIEEKVRGFEERKQGQRDALMMALNKEPMPPVKYSSVVRDDSIIEKKLAAAGNFDYAMRYNKSLAGLKKEEEAAHVEAWLKSRQLRIDRLEEKLAKEEEDMHDACGRERLRFEFQRQVAMETLQKNQNALRHDVDHALAHEFAQRREVRKSLTAAKHQPKSYKSRQDTSATFFGRLMMERVGKGSLDVPSVCKMHWGIVDSPRFGEEGDKKKKKRPNTSHH